MGVLAPKIPPSTLPNKIHPVSASLVQLLTDIQNEIELLLLKQCNVWEIF